MKKYCYTCLLFVFTVLIFAIPSHAQYQIGVRGGVNFAKFGPANVLDFNSNIRPNMAVIFNMPLNSAFSIQVEPGFSARGAKYDEDVEFVFNSIMMLSRESGKILVNYIEMPILFQYRTCLGVFDLMLSAGPDVKLLAGQGKVKGRSRLYHDGVIVTDNQTDTKFGGESDLRIFDYGLTGGAGLAYPRKNLKLFVEARYHLGLSKVLRGGVDPHNRGLSAHAGILFPIKF